MKKLLENLKKEKCLCEIYNLNNDPTRFAVGYILYVDKDSILIRAISPNGKDDGFVYSLIDDIAIVENETDYLNELKILLDKQNISFKDIEILGDDILTEFMSYIKANNVISTFELFGNEDRTVCGIVNEVKDNLAEVSLINERGAKAGNAYFEIDEISTIIIDSQAEQKLSILYNEKNK